MSPQLSVSGRTALTAIMLALFAAHRPTRAQENSPDAQPQIAKAAAVLASNASRQDKVNACRRLAAIGGSESIAPLAALLPDKDLSHAARMGLEAIPDPAAGEALREALSHLNGLPLVGVINSLAARQELRAVPELSRYVTDPDPQVAAAACAALGTLATPEALARLRDAQPQVAKEVIPEWGNACLRGVAALRQRGQLDQAAELCQLVRQSPVPAHIHHSATRLAMLCQPENAGSLLQELLSSTDRAAMATALTVSRELDSPRITQVLLASLPALDASRQIQVVRLLGDRGDPAARDALVRYATGGDATMRAAALTALGNAGDVSTFPLLLSAADDPDARVVLGTQRAMVAMQGDDVDVAIIAAFGTATGAKRRILIDVAGQRRIAAAAALLIPLLDDPEVSTRTAALLALGQVLDPTQIGVLTARLVAKVDAAERDALEQGLRAVCRRAVDQDGCAETCGIVLPTAIKIPGSWSSNCWVWWVGPLRWRRWHPWRRMPMTLSRTRPHDSWDAGELPTWPMS